MTSKLWYGWSTNEKFAWTVKSWWGLSLQLLNLILKICYVNYYHMLNHIHFIWLRPSVKRYFMVNHRNESLNLRLYFNLIYLGMLMVMESYTMKKIPTIQYVWTVNPLLYSGKYIIILYLSYTKLQNIFIKL